jgi:hypothetical protein
LRSGCARARSTLEVLEDRLAPATLTVDRSADTAHRSDPYLSLREAIAIVNSPELPTGLSEQILGQISGTLHEDGTDTILFDPTQVNTPITLGGTHLELTLLSSTATITIDGGPTGVTVDGHSASRIFQVDPGVQATLDHLTLTHGRATGAYFGGGIYNAGGTLTVSDITLDSNFASFGGGLSNNGGTLTVSHCTLRSNSTYNWGGGVYNDGGTLTMSGCTLESNTASVQNGGGTGGGIYNNAGTLTVTDSTIRSNVANSQGGALFIYDGLVTVDRCTLDANSVPNTAFGSYYAGGIDNYYGTVTVSNSTISGNRAPSAAGIINFEIMTVSHCTISGNSATGPSSGVMSALGGGIANGGTMTVTDSTISSNSAGSATTTSSAGGGIDNGGTLTVTNSTLSANSAYSGGGIITSSLATLYLQNTIIAGNRSTPSRGPDINGSVQRSSSYNLVGIADGTLSGISDGTQGNQIGTPSSPIDPLLAPLGDYGGPTQTMPPLAGSPALDAGDPGQAGTPDQRGVVRTGGVNIGAFQASAAYLVLSAPHTVQAGVPFDLVVAVYDALGQLAVGYSGTLHFSTTDPDPNVVLPPDYTFGLSDGGTVTFTAGVTLFSAGEQTLTATDSDAGISGSTVVTL